MSSKNGNVEKRCQKEFIFRNSSLTDIFESPFTCKLYNFYLIVVLGLFLQTSAKEYVKTGRVTFGVEVVRVGFRQFDKALLIWLGCFASACGAYFVFGIWYRLRAVAKDVTTVFNWFGATLLVLYYYYSFLLVGNVVHLFDFNPPCIVFVTLESVRFLMKLHSFVRTKAAEPSTCFNFSHFVYYLFAPTLIYRDDYPRTKTINWYFVLQCLLECVSVLYVFACIILNCYPTPEKWRQKFTINEVLLLVMENLPYGALILSGVFFQIFHSTQNLFAEILRFGDRSFYLDWWNEYNFNSWLSKWNRIVQDWLYYYIYRDFKEYVCDSGFLARLTVFLVSFGVHEWIMFCWIGGFFPLMFIVFITVVLPLSYWEPPKEIIFNVFLWVAGILLVNVGFALYMFEWYARSTVPLTDTTTWRWVVPRFISCDCIFQT